VKDRLDQQILPILEEKLQSSEYHRAVTFRGPAAP
jgi:hypothetical protein